MADMTLKHMVLGLLHYKSLHGYRICEHIERHFGILWTINPGQIYPVLRSLEEEGLIEMVEVAQYKNKGPYRKLYSITAAGKEVFKNWLGEDPGRNVILKHPFLARFIFFDYGDKEKILQQIDEQIGVWQAEREVRETNKERWNNQSIYLRLIAQLGSNTNDMYLDWLKTARQEIANS